MVFRRSHHSHRHHYWNCPRLSSNAFLISEQPRPAPPSSRQPPQSPQPMNRDFGFNYSDAIIEVLKIEAKARAAGEEAAMAVTYYVALPFGRTEDGVAPGGAP